MHSLSDKEKKERKIERLYIPINLPHLIISNNIYDLFILCQALYWYIGDNTKSH